MAVSSPACARRICAILSVITALAVSPSTQVAVIHEPVWQVRANVPVLAPCGAHISPVDGSIWVGSRLGQASGGAIVRIDPSFLTTVNVVSCDRPASVVIDPASGDVFFTEDYAGFIDRIPFGSNVRQRWVDGFHSGDDDPWGMAIAPAGYTGAVLAAGEALVCDHGVNGPRQIWGWRPAAAQGEWLVKPDHGTLVNPMDVAISTSSVWFVDAVPAPGRVFELLPGGAARLLTTSQPLPQVGGIAVDPASESVLLRTHNEVLRLVPATGAVTSVLEIPQGNGGAGDGIDVSVDGRWLVLTLTNANRVLVFERTASFGQHGTGCAGTLGVPAIIAAGSRPRLGTTLTMAVGPVPLAQPVVGILGLAPGRVLLDPFGMPACQLLVRNDHAMLVTVRQAPDRALWSLGIPAQPVLEGTELYLQALVGDPGRNPFGAVVSDAARAVLSAF